MISKTLIAQNIVMALYNIPYLPPASNPNVANMVKKNSKVALGRKLAMASSALKSVGRTLNL